MLRLPQFEIATPSSVDEVVALLTQHGENAVLIAGGTDLLPNMKHELFTPELVVSLAEVEGLRGIKTDADGTIVIGAMTTLDEVAADPTIQSRAPALAQATSLISGPQLRRMGTLGGNVMLDTRCQWYNQTYFWRQALGFCLKKDGTLCHVVESGRKCVAAASNDSAPALMTLGARLVFHGSDGRRELLIDDLWKSDGIYNKNVSGELLAEIRIPGPAPSSRGAYGKLRDRGSIDFPLFGVAVRLDLSDDLTRILDADVCAIALQARPVRVKKAAELLTGLAPTGTEFEAAVDDLAARAYKQCHPLANIPGDEAYRREMVPVYVRRTVLAAAAGAGPVHHL